MISPNNLAKNSVTPSSRRKGGYALWDDSITTWDSITLCWDSPVYSVSNLDKNSIAPTNKVKN